MANSRLSSPEVATSGFVPVWLTFPVASHQSLAAIQVLKRRGLHLLALPASKSSVWAQAGTNFEPQSLLETIHRCRLTVTATTGIMLVLVPRPEPPFSLLFRERQGKKRKERKKRME